jgi:FkbM family methyltransferase
MSAHQHKVFSRFQGWSGEVPEGLLVEWIGDRVPAALIGQQWTPGVRSATSAPPFHEEYFEWIDVLEMALQAADVYTFLELGAGYGRWSSRAAWAARQLGKRYRLGLAEAAPKHVRQIHEVMAVNRISRSDYVVFESAIARERGEGCFVVEYPDGNAPPVWYGQALTQNSMSRAQVVGEHEGFPLWRMKDGWGVIKVPQIPLSEVLSQYDNVDLADLDLQGAEAGAVEEALPLLTERVRRLHIGTHSHEIEANLRELLGKAGWTCLRDYACTQDNDTPFGRISFVDGVQTWTNPRYSGPWAAVRRALSKVFRRGR